MKTIVRQWVETAPDEFRSSDKLESSDINSALRVLRLQLRETLTGLAPIFGRDVLLQICREVIDEDFIDDRNPQ